MNSSIRAPPPAPLNLRTSTSSSTSDHGATGYFDSAPINIEKQRTSSYSSVMSSPSSPPSSSPRTSHSWIKPSATINLHTTCGRHTDQLLFGGPSLTELARSMLKKH